MQVFIPGTEPPPDPADHPEIAPLIDALLKAEAEAKRAAEVRSIRRDTLMAKMAELGVPKVKYPDPKSGKPMWMKLDDAKRLKREKVHEGKKAQHDAEHDAARDAWAGEVERRRTGVDPFAATRTAMDETPAQIAAREADEARTARRARRAAK